MNTGKKNTKYIKSFSKGQITVPKEIRQELNLGDTFWLRVYVDKEKLIAEPVEKEENQEKYSEDLLSIKGDWFSETELKEVRKEVENRLKRNV